MKNVALLSACSFLALTAAMGCASNVRSTRVVEDPAGKAVSYGAPRNMSYVAEFDAMQDKARITVYRSSQCDVFSVTVMQRFEEKLQGKRVVERNPLSRRQVVGDSTGKIDCDQSYARDVDVMLEVNGSRFPLGKTNAEGQVQASLSELFQVGSYEEAPESATIMLRPNQAKPMVAAGKVSFPQLAKQQERVAELVAKLGAILAKGEAGQSSDDVTRSYEIYSQLQEIAPADPRVEGLRARFWELFYGRKLVENRERMEDNLKSLSEAQDILKVMGDAAIPIYVQAAVNSGSMDRRALEWSSLRLIRAIRGGVVCSTGYSYSQLPSYGWPADVRMAANYTHFAYGSSYDVGVNHACRSF